MLLEMGLASQIIWFHNVYYDIRNVEVDLIHSRSTTILLLTEQNLKLLFSRNDGKDIVRT